MSVYSKVQKSMLKGIVRRRKWYFLIPFFICILFAVGAAIFLSPVYKSEATIVIENQDIPEEYVKSTVTTYVNERLQMMQRRMMSHTKLKEIVKQYHLYSDAKSESEMIQEMQKNFELKTINVAINNRKTGQTSNAMIAFTLSFEGADPAIVQKVAETLANLYIEEDIKIRQKAAKTTANFLEKQLDIYKKYLHGYGEKIRKFKEKHFETLPGSMNSDLQTIMRLEQEKARINTRILTIKEKKIYLESQIANVDPLTPIITEQGREANNPYERLKALRLKLIRMEAILSSKHPDIKSLKSEIKKLEHQVGYTDAATEKAKLLKSLEVERAQLGGKSGAKHPEYIKLTKQIKILSEEVKELKSQYSAHQMSNVKPDNPAYMNLMAQIIAMQTELDALELDRPKIQQKLDSYQQKIERLPMVEEEYGKLTLDFENAKHKYHEILSKLMTAKASEEMDVSQRGQRFSILEPALLPSEPYKPNRMKIMLLGFVLGSGIGLCLAALFEGLDSSVRSIEEVEGLLSYPVLASVSFFHSPEQESRRQRNRRKVLLFSAIVFVMAGLCCSIYLTIIQK